MPEGKPPICDKGGQSELDESQEVPVAFQIGGAGAIFKAYPEAIADLVGEIYRSRLAIPNFQRDFVWEPDNTLKLLTSILGRFPAGTLLFWHAPPDSLDPREFAGAPTLVKDQLQRLVLDGQQRLTALYRVLTGVTDERYFVDLGQLVDRTSLQTVDGGAINWDTALTFEEPSAVQKRKNETPEWEDPAWQFHAWKFPLHQLQRFDYWLADFLKTLPSGQVDATQQALWAVRDKHLNQLLQYHFPVITLNENTTLSAVCRVFETLNSTGEELGPFELLTARFMPRGVNLRALLDQSMNDHPVVFKKDDFDVDRYSVLQAVCLRAIGSAQRSSIMDDLSADHVKKHWGGVVDGMEAAIELLRDDCGVLIKEWLPYTMVLIPIAAVWDMVEPLSGTDKAKAREKITKYFWSSVFTTNYDQGANSQAQADYHALRDWLSSDNAKPPEAVGELPISAESLFTATVKRKALYRGLMALTLSQGAKDFHTAQKLTPARIRDDKIDAHHVFPRKCFDEGVDVQGLSPELILNRALIDASTNRRIGKRRPSIYLAEIEEELTAARLKEILDSHLIDQDPMRSDSYRDYITERLALVVDAIERLTGKTISKLEEPAAVKPPQTAQAADAVKRESGAN
jgi:hypothetical protein